MSFSILEIDPGFQWKISRSQEENEVNLGLEREGCTFGEEGGGEWIDEEDSPLINIYKLLII